MELENVHAAAYEFSSASPASLSLLSSLPFNFCLAHSLSPSLSLDVPVFLGCISFRILIYAGGSTSATSNNEAFVCLCGSACGKSFRKIVRFHCSYSFLVRRS